MAVAVAILTVKNNNNNANDNDIGTVDCRRCISNPQRIALLFAQPAGGSNESQMCYGDTSCT